MPTLPQDKLDTMTKRFDSIEAALSSGPSADEFVRLSKEYAELEPIVRPIQAYQKLLRDLDAAEDLAKSGDREMAEMAAAELADLRPRIEQAVAEIRILLLPKDAADDRSVILEVRAGTGGDEAALFAGDLLRMYQRYADLMGWKFSLMEETPGEMGGYKEVVANITGKGAYARMKFESGVHRVQRVPTTESQGRIHTSAATVAVLPEAEDIDIESQHVNTTDSAVRITHLPTGIVVTASQKSQHQNRATAMKVLQARLYETQRDARDTARSEARKEQVGSGDRSERIRTYNFPQGRVTDHRLNLTLYKLDKVIAGEALDELVSALITEHQASQLAAMEGMN